MKALGLALILALVIPTALAAGKNYKFELDMEGIVGAKNLRSGTYRVEVKCAEDGKGTVSFYDGYRLAAQVPCNMVEQNDAADTYGVSYATNAQGKRVVSSIFLKGSKEKIVISSGN